ncbi:hypothetical protein CleRT_06450 [Candidatus Coxiella mudrowiae]|uniref:Transposase n=1 Tax=Candidatus Coxiella mudrowiae TaxID=2054173 RepID=A0ABN4HQL0_9COXI|nr:hypothetical protein CleRT_05010 [Candidatus Coxiella mudrowiae]AKQ33506.1 hypothetical protein CleRT_06450 [Candidatus Coxiella mudrowiae]
MRFAQRRRIDFQSTIAHNQIPAFYMALLTLGVRLIQNSENAHLGRCGYWAARYSNPNDGLLKGWPSLRGVGNRLYDYRSQFWRGVSNDAVYKIIRSIMRLMKQCKHREE